MKFTEKEMLCRYNMLDIPKNVYDNLMELRERLNMLGKYFLAPRVLSCAYRDPEHNKRVGGAKNSSHLTGEACDIVDRDGKLKEFLKTHPELLEKYDLYAEDYFHTLTWCHLQIRPTKSGKRVFLP